MAYSALKEARGFAATYTVKLSDRQHERYVEALARLLVHAHNEGYNAGYKRGLNAAQYDDSGSKDK